MKTSRQLLALLCIALTLAPFSAFSQSYSYMANKDRNWLIRNYVPSPAPPVSFANSPRLESLVRAGNLYLGLQDAIAIALENNLDIELQRYGPQQAEANLLRARAGGLLRGVSTSIQAGPNSAVQQSTGGLSTELAARPEAPAAAIWEPRLVVPSSPRPVQPSSTSIR
jgi:outer membrane protein